MSSRSCTVIVFKIPFTAVAKELVKYLEAVLGPYTVYACEICTERSNWKSKGFGLVQFDTETAALRAISLAEKGCLKFQHAILHLQLANKDIQERPSIQLKNAQFFMGCLTNPETLQVLWSSTSEVTTEMDCVNRKFIVSLIVTGNNGANHYKLVWQFEHLLSVSLCTIRGKKTKGFLLQAKVAPQVKKLESELGTAHAFIFGDRYVYFREEFKPPWVRTTDFTTDHSLGQSYAFFLESFTIEQPLYQEFVTRLENLGSYLPSENEIYLESRASYSLPQALVPVLSSSGINKLPFDVVFRVNSLVQCGSLCGMNLDNHFFDLLHDSRASKALEIISHIKDAWYEPINWLNKQVTLLNEQKVPTQVRINSDEGLMPVRRLLVTPTRIYCLGPEIEVSNRVIRHFSKYMDDFLRVSFVDEDMTPLRSSALVVRSKSNQQWEYKFTNVYERIRSVLRQGFNLGEKNFEFLAFSASQLREHSVWMFASNGEVTAENIRMWMGNFMSIRNVAKCAARMGQCFSSSLKTLDAYTYEVEEIPDIIGEFDSVKYCFSDGIGKISESFATEVAANCGFKKLGSTVPSAFQIRYGGYKGVVAVDPTSFYKLSLRPSMRKFPSQLVGLDILEWTHYIPCYLNRQVIMLLSTLGVDDSVFEMMQHQMIIHLNKALVDRNAALDFLDLYGCSNTTLYHMLLAGYEPCSEPFLGSMLRAFHASQLEGLRKKSRIFVSKGRMLMGCLDETATLEYGQVFIQVSPPPGGLRFADDGLASPETIKLERGNYRTYVIQGMVGVAKNPCLHPGDVRVLQAVNCSKLVHMVDCIVFPQKGKRPHPNECSGSDLDGDIYFVTWDKQLIPPATESPMDYFPPKPVVLDHSPTIEEIQDYFVNYMVNDSLGIISEAHLVFSDKEMGMARDPKCVELAKLFSVAVDFPKTGVPAVLPSNMKIKCYPDFMEKDVIGGNSYFSTRILGKLYRAVQECNLDLNFTFTKDDAVKFYDKDLLVEGFEFYLEEALTCKQIYDAKLIILMQQYGIESEAELFSGFIRNLSTKNRKNLKEKVTLTLSALKKEVRSWLLSDTAKNNPLTDTKDREHVIFKRVSAWYHATYFPDIWLHQLQKATDHSIQLFSFPWTVHEELLSIKRINQMHKYFKKTM